MKITRTMDYELIARLNKPILELHASLYPQYFTEYNFEATRDSFKGGVISPILANVYLHYVLDLWFEKRVRKHCKGQISVIRLLQQ
ncbi:hypothetical protein V7075_16625 [Neobacillus drentensis]|uniref:hypothetical protein n=1 Tax=Neobacillus drentensis TaxID=220684 RepID=UPI002FFFE568